MPHQTRNHEYQVSWSGRDVWHGHGLDPADGLHRLSQECLDEIDAALELLARNPLPVLALDPDEFSMPACRAAMAGVRRELDHGRGFVIIDRLDPETMDAGQMTAVYWLLARMVGRPVAQKWSDGRLLYDVTDLGRPSGNGVRPDVTNEEQSFHTDNSYNLCPPDHVGLLCRQPAMEGGMSPGCQHEGGRKPDGRGASGHDGTSLPAVLLRPAARARGRGRSLRGQPGALGR